MKLLKCVQRALPAAVLVCLGFSPARAWIYDPSKPLIYEMRIAFETDKWINMYSTATVLSKSDNTVAFRVVANSTTTGAVYQLVVTTQGNVGIGTENPAAKLDVNGAVSASTVNASAYSVGGTSGWTGSFVAVSTEAADSYTKLLLHMDGTNGGTGFIDSATGKTVTANGNAQISTGQSKFGGASGYFDGSGDYLTVANDGSLDLGTGDFTVDFWFNRHSLSGDQVLWAGGGESYGVLLFYAVGGAKTFSLSTWDSSTMGTSAAAYELDTWHHIAVVKSAGTYTVYFDGTSLGSGALTTPSTSANWGIGAYNNGSVPINGWLDELRVSKGIARWTANFTPPTAAYGAVSKTITISNGIITGVSD